MLNIFLQMIEILSRVNKASKEKVPSFNARTGIPGGGRELEFLLLEKGVGMGRVLMLPHYEHEVPDPLQALVRESSKSRKKGCCCFLCFTEKETEAQRG